MDGEWEFAGLFITWILGVGQARDGAALGWTDASPKRNHRISSTQEERRGKERKKGLKVGGRRRRLTAKVGGKACVRWEGFEKGSEGWGKQPRKQHNAEPKVNRKHKNTQKCFPTFTYTFILTHAHNICRQTNSLKALKRRAMQCIRNHASEKERIRC